MKLSTPEYIYIYTLYDPHLVFYFWFTLLKRKSLLMHPNEKQKNKLVQALSINTHFEKWHPSS